MRYVHASRKAAGTCIGYVGSCCELRRMLWRSIYFFKPLKINKNKRVNDQSYVACPCGGYELTTQTKKKGWDLCFGFECSPYDLLGEHIKTSCGLMNYKERMDKLGYENWD